ncbi:hypothetical protein BH11PSE10_BH11PSE10_01490 [soil metagenome]
MTEAQVPGLAVALIRNGRLAFSKAYGLADRERGELLKTDTVMAGASLTKAAFAYLVLQLVDEGVINLDRPLPLQLRLPLHLYADYADLADDPRWREITPRMLLSHSSGLINWRWINPDRKLTLNYAPGKRYVYSGEGIQLLQLIVEERTRVPLAALMQKRVFDRFGMVNTSMVWRDDFAAHAATGYAVDGSTRGHAQRHTARAAGSMDTTLNDYAGFLAGVLRGDGLSAAARQQMLSAQVTIVSPQQFPSHWPGETTVNQGIALSAGLGWIVYRSPRGPAFFKEGSDEGTSNFALGFASSRDGLVMLSNSGNADQLFNAAAELLLGPPATCLPWFWMGYIPHDRPELRKPGARDMPLGPGCTALDQLPEGSRR